MVSTSQSLLKVTLPLVPRANKPITTAELIKRLADVSNQLIDANQDDPAVKAQLEKTIAPQLIDKNLLQHKDKGVKSYVAVGIVEVLRICAPEAPFNASQLKELFELFLKQFKFLEDTGQAYYSNSLHILKILEQTKCVVIINDIGNASGQLVSSFFKTFFDLVRPSMNKDIEHLMTNILEHLIDEGESLPNQVVEVILAQFIRKQPPKEKKKDQTDLTSLGIGGYPAAYTMAKGICQDCADHLSRDVCAYFSDVLLPDTGGNDEQVDVEDLEKAHHLVNELYLASPHILSNTIPLLEAELQVENTDVRLLAVECVGKMAGARVSSANFAITYLPCWNAWLARRNDKNPSVRVKWLEAVPDILANNPDVAGDLSGKLTELLLSPDDKVRFAAVKAFGSLSYPLLLSRISKQTLESLAERCRDRKNAIRLEAVVVLARMWDLAYYDIASGQSAATETFSWIPSILVSTMYTNDRDLSATLYKALYTVLTPLSITDDMLRTRRLLLFISQLDRRSRMAFHSIPLRQKQSEPYFQAYVDRAEQYNGGVVETGAADAAATKLDGVCTSISNLLGMPETAAQRKSDLKKWAEANDRRGFKLMRDLVDPEKEFKAWRKTQKELLQRIEDMALSLIATFGPFIFYHTLGLWNKTTVENAITALSEPDISASSRTVAHALLKDLALSHPKLFSGSIPSLADWIITEAGQASPNRSKEDKEAVEDILKAVSRLDDLDLPGKQGKDFVDALKTFALEGETEKQGRRATAVLLKLKRRTVYSSDLVKIIIPNLKFENEFFVNRLGSLSKLMILASDTVESYADDIIDTCIKDILLQCHEPQEGGDDWVEDADLGPECRAKILALKILANRLRSNLDPDTAEALAKPVLRLLGTLVQSGELRHEEDTPASTRSRLRLSAGLIVLKLCTTRINKVDVYESMFTPKSFNVVSLLPQDDCPEVRHGFLEALKKALNNNILAHRWFTLCFLAAFEPNEQFKEAMVRWLKNLAERFRGNRALVMERTFPRLLHLLSHHTDFSTEESDLDDMATYINFYLDCVGTADNYALFFHLAQRVKQARDALDLDKSENLYVLSDLAQEIIKLRASANDWVLVTHPQREKLPSDLFAPLQSQAVAQGIARKAYLPSEFATSLPMKLKRGMRAAPRKQKPLKPKSNVQPKLPKSPPSPTTKKRPATVKKPAVVKKAKASGERVTSGERRTSGRQKSAVKYVETGDSTDDDKMDEDLTSEAEPMEEIQVEDSD